MFNINICEISHLMYEDYSAILNIIPEISHIFQNTPLSSRGPVEGLTKLSF